MEGKVSMLVARLGHTNVNEPDVPRIDLAGKLTYEGGEEDCLKLVNALGRTKVGVNHVDLSSNRLGDKVAFQIAKAIAKNTSIQHLLLHDNAFSAKGMDALLKALGCNLSIIELTIEGQSAEPKEEKRLLRHLKNVLASTREFQKARSGASSSVNLLGRDLSELTPAFVSQLGHLTVLNLNHNKLKNLPEEISSVSQLVELRLAENQLEVIPSGVSKLTNLQILDVRYNERLVTLPMGLAQLSKLECLEFGANKQDKMKKLQVLRETRHAIEVAAKKKKRGSNYQMPVPLEIVYHGGKEIIAWLQELARGEQIENQFKVMIVGAPDVGKSSVAEWIFEKSRMSHHNHQAYTPTPTHGVVRFWAEGNAKRYRFNHSITVPFFECGGDEVGPEFMLTARTTYLVVFNGLKPDEEHSRLEYWMKTIINFVQSPVPIIAIATHADDKDMTPAQRKKVTTVFENLKENFPALEHLFFVNARLGKGMDELRCKLVDAAADYFWLEQRIPRSYLSLSSALNKLAISSVHHQSIAKADLGPAVPSSAHVVSALQFLADMGHLIYCPPIVTLYPHWISEALGEAPLSVETKIAREVPLTSPVGEKEVAKQLSALQVELTQLEKEFNLFQALIRNKNYWPQEGVSKVNATNPLVVPKLKLGT